MTKSIYHCIPVLTIVEMEEDHHITVHATHVVPPAAIVPADKPEPKPAAIPESTPEPFIRPDPEPGLTRCVGG